MTWPPSACDPGNITPPDVPEVELPTPGTPLCALRRVMDVVVLNLAMNHGGLHALRGFMASRSALPMQAWPMTWEDVLERVTDEVWNEHSDDPDAHDLAIWGATHDTLAALAMALGIETVMLNAEEVEAWDAMQAERYAGEGDMSECAIAAGPPSRLDYEELDEEQDDA